MGKEKVNWILDMIKRYKIEKIVFAENITDAENMVIGGETSYVQLLDDIKEPSDMGFTNQYEQDKQRNKVVRKIQKRS